MFHAFESVDLLADDSSGVATDLVTGKEVVCRS